MDYSIYIIAMLLRVVHNENSVGALDFKALWDFFLFYQIFIKGGHNITDIEKAKELDIKAVAENFGVVFTRDNKCLCFMHQERTASMVIYKNKLKCFGCGANLSTIDVFMHFSGEADVVQASKKLLNNEYSKSDSNFKRIEVIKDKAYKRKTFEDKKKELIFKESATVNNFLKERGLLRAKEILKLNDMEICIDKYGQISFISEKLQWIQGRGHNGYKYNYGNVPVLFLKALEPSDTWTICEGLTDSLTALEMNLNSICLNSINNVNRLISMLNKRLERESIKQKFIISLDTDDRAEKYIYQLIDYFAENKISFDLFTELYASNCKDLSEFYCKKRGSLC